MGILRTGPRLAEGRKESVSAALARDCAPRPDPFNETMRARDPHAGMKTTGNATCARA